MLLLKKVRRRWAKQQLSPLWRLASDCAPSVEWRAYIEGPHWMFAKWMKSERTNTYLTPSVRQGARVSMLLYSTSHNSSTSRHYLCFPNEETKTNEVTRQGHSVSKRRIWTCTALPSLREKYIMVLLHKKYILYWFLFSSTTSFFQ